MYSVLRYISEGSEHVDNDEDFRIFYSTLQETLTKRIFLNTNKLDREIGGRKMIPNKMEMHCSVRCIQSEIRVRVVSASSTEPMLPRYSFRQKSLF